MTRLKQNSSKLGGVYGSASTGGITLLSSFLLSACSSGGSTHTTQSGFTLSNGVYRGTGQGEALQMASSSSSLTVVGLGGADTIVTGSGADLVRSGTGVDNVNTGGGDDTAVLVGTTLTNQYTSLDIPVSLAKVVSLSTLNGQSQSEDAIGENINLGTGSGDTLHLYGTLDLTGMNITGAEITKLHSDVTMTSAQASTLGAISGDGQATLRLEASSTSSTLDLSTLALTSINHIELQANNILEVQDATALANLGLSSLSGAGQLKISDTTGLTPSLLLGGSVLVTDSAGADLSATVGVARLTLNGTNFIPEYVGRSTAYLEPTSATTDVVWLANLTTNQANEGVIGNIQGYFLDPDTNAMSFSLTGASSNQLSIKADASGATWLVLNAGSSLTLGETFSVTVVCTDGLGASVNQQLTFWVADVGDSESQTIAGSGGDDTLLGGPIDVTSGSDADILNGGAGDDHLNGGYGDDSLNGGAGDDLLKGRFDDDTITGGTGSDTLYYLLQEINGQFVSPDGNDIFTDYMPGTDKLQFEQYRTIGEQVDTLAEFKAGLGSLYSATAAADLRSINIQFADQNNNANQVSIDLQFDTSATTIDTNLVTLNGTNTYDFNNADDFMTALGGDLSLDII